MTRPRPLQTAIGLTAGLALAGSGYALAAPRTAEIRACASKSGALTLEARRCPRGDRALTWNVRGPAGLNGTSVRLNPSVRVTEVAPSSPARASIIRSVHGVDTLKLALPQGVTGAAGAAGPAGPAGPAGVAGANTGPNAWGEVWVGSQQAELAYGSGGVSVNGGIGGATVKVTTCSEPTPNEPIITVTANDDKRDTLQGANNTTSGQPTAYVSSFANDNLPGDHVLIFTVTTSATNNQVVNSDFAFTVSC